MIEKKAVIFSSNLITKQRKWYLWFLNIDFPWQWKRRRLSFSLKKGISLTTHKSCYISQKWNLLTTRTSRRLSPFFRHWINRREGLSFFFRNWISLTLKRRRLSFFLELQFNLDSIFISYCWNCHVFAQCDESTMSTLKTPLCRWGLFKELNMEKMHV